MTNDPFAELSDVPLDRVTELENTLRSIRGLLLDYNLLPAEFDIHADMVIYEIDRALGMVKSTGDDHE